MKNPEWAKLKDEDLLKWRISDLGLSIENSELIERVEQLYRELDAANLAYRPKVYLGDEWFSPEGMLAISIPFYLAHPRLKALEQSQMLEVEGGTPDWCQRLLRHEAGHCFDHAFRFSKRRKWREIFGPPDQEYAPEHYHPKPYSKSFVQHLGNWYAQAHPDEDFAETFAVVLDPGVDWKKQYRTWPGAHKKLAYVERLVRETRGTQPKHAEKGALPYQAAKKQTTLAKYYAKRRKENETDYPSFYDPDLKRIFNGTDASTRRTDEAARFMQKHRKEVVESVSYWTGEKKFPIERLVRKFTERCEKLDLRLGRSEADTHLELSAYLATLVTHYLFTGKFKRSV